MRAIVSLVALTLLLAACGIDEGTASTNPTTNGPVPTTENNEGGFGAPSQAPGEFDLGPGRPVVGTLQLADDGCWYAELNGTPRLAVFPLGFDLNPETGGELVDATGTVYRDGDRFDATASVVWEADIPGGVDGRWGNYIAFCRPELDELIVFDSLTHEFDPSALETSELIEMVETAAWTEHFPCGRGWATSTADQRVGLVIYEAQPDTSVENDRIVLPDPGWDASVLIGKNLFSEHCNDAIEDWIALPAIAVRWPLTAGVITIVDQVPAPDEGPARVRASLDDGQVDSGAGAIALPKIELDNPSYNFFAG